MNQKSRIQSPNIKAVQEQVKKNTPASIIGLIAAQLDRADESRRRIEEEGIVVRNISGCVVEHPCVKVEVGATKLAAELLLKHKRM